MSPQELRETEELMGDIFKACFVLLPPWFLVTGWLRWKGHCARLETIQHMLESQRQTFERHLARIEADRHDDGLRQKWSGKADPDN